VGGPWDEAVAPAFDAAVVAVVALFVPGAWCERRECEMSGERQGLDLGLAR
jgi:hypothetical protein